MKAAQISMTFEGGLADFDRVHAWLNSHLEGDPGIDDKTRRRIRLALAEAFSNAVLHAHGGRAGIPVGIRIAFMPNPEACIKLDVTDRGPGFQLPPAGRPDDDAERGRGVMIMRTLAERVDYAGNTLSIWLRPS